MPADRETIAEAKEIGRQVGIAEAIKLVDSDLRDALKAGDYDSYDYIAEDDWDVWLDSTGALVQTKRSIVYRSNEGEVVATSELTSRISGIDEPNLIAVPDIP